jgi:hypothetical protein
MAAWHARLALAARLGNVLVIGLVTMAQRDLKQMIGYSSVMHMGYAFLGIACFSVLGAGGVVLLMVAHGLSVALLFLLATSIHHRTHTFDLAEMGGLAQKTPVLAAFFVAATLASIGLPGFANFWGELTIFVALWKFSPGSPRLAVAGVVISAIYGLRAAARCSSARPPRQFAKVAAERPPQDLAGAKNPRPHPARGAALRRLLAEVDHHPAQRHAHRAAASGPRATGRQVTFFRMNPVFLPSRPRRPADNQWVAILPELMLGCLALALLVLELVLPKASTISSRASPSRRSSRLAGRAARQLSLSHRSRDLQRPPAPHVMGQSCGSSSCDVDPRLPARHDQPREAEDAARRVLPPRARRHRGDDAPRAEQPLRDALRRARDGDHRVLHPRQLFPRQPALARGRPEIPHHGRAQLGDPALRHRAALRRGRQPALPAAPAHDASTPSADFLAANPDNFLASAGIVLVLAGVAFKIGAFRSRSGSPTSTRARPRR